MIIGEGGYSKRRPHFYGVSNLLDIEAMMGIRWMLCPLEEGPVELKSNDSSSLRRDIDKQFHHMWSLPVLSRLIVLIQ